MSAPAWQPAPCADCGETTDRRCARCARAVCVGCAGEHDRRGAALCPAWRVAPMGATSLRARASMALDSEEALSTFLSDAASLADSCAPTLALLCRVLADEPGEVAGARSEAVRALAVRLATVSAEDAAGIALSVAQGLAQWEPARACHVELDPARRDAAYREVMARPIGPPRIVGETGRHRGDLAGVRPSEEMRAATMAPESGADSRVSIACKCGAGLAGLSRRQVLVVMVDAGWHVGGPPGEEIVTCPSCAPTVLQAVY